jgi:hypothetical protein
MNCGLVVYTATAQYLSLLLTLALAFGMQILSAHELEGPHDLCVEQSVHLRHM